MDEEKVINEEAENKEVKAEKAEKPKKKKESKEAKYLLELAARDEKYLRLLAEYDNYKKRTVKERDAIELSAKATTMAAILPLADNIERAVSSKGDAESIKAGIEMALKMFLDELVKQGLEEIPTDIPFNPELHNAVMHVEDESYGEGEIVQVFQKGYRLKDKVIRYAMVKVAN